MLYRLAHIIRDGFPWLWQLVGRLNSFLFSLRYGKKLLLIPKILDAYSGNFAIDALTENNLSAMVSFFKSQPEEAFKFFKPHGFDKKALQALITDRAFLAYIVRKDEEVVGYFFLRCSFTGKAYRGYMTDVNHRRMGINKQMGKCATDIAGALGIPMFGSIAPDNVASLKSAEAVNEVRILEALKNGDYLVQYLPKEDRKES